MQPRLWNELSQEVRKDTKLTTELEAVTLEIIPSHTYVINKHMHKFSHQIKQRTKSLSANQTVCFRISKERNKVSNCCYAVLNLENVEDRWIYSNEAIS